jgi:hypothetical protein
VDPDRRGNRGVGALTDRRWTVFLAAVIALPVLWPTGFAILAGVAALDRDNDAQRRL